MTSIILVISIILLCFDVGLGQLYEKVPKIAVVAIKTEGLNQEQKFKIIETVNNAFTESRKFKVIPYGLIEELFEEQGENINDCVTESCALEKGKLLRVDYVVSLNIFNDSINRDKLNIFGSLKTLNVEDGEVENAVQFEFKGDFKKFIEYVRLKTLELQGIKVPQRNIRGIIFNAVAGISAGTAAYFAYKGYTVYYNKYKNAVTTSEMKYYKSKTIKNLNLSRIFFGVFVVTLGGKYVFRHFSNNKIVFSTIYFDDRIKLKIIYHF